MKLGDWSGTGSSGGSGGTTGGLRQKANEQSGEVLLNYRKGMSCPRLGGKKVPQLHLGSEVVGGNGSPCTLLADDQEGPSGTTDRALTIQEYEPDIVYKSGRLHEDADTLSRYPVDSAEEEEAEDKYLPVWIVAWTESREKTK
jgi:hypothetical protein